MRVELSDLKRQRESIKGEIDDAVRKVLNNGCFILGDEVSMFETEFASYCDAKFAVGVDSGMSALELGMLALGIGPGDEVITPVNSFIASSAAISATGAIPVFADADPSTYNIAVEEIKKKITPRTKAIMPVHLYGQPASMAAIQEIANARGLFIIEDACQAHGACYQKRKVGSLGYVAAFSFYPSKNLGAYGDGGMVVTNDAKVAETVKAMRNYGQSDKNLHVVMPRNHRLDAIQAAVLRVKLRYLDRWNERRREVAALYDALLPDREGMLKPHVANSCEHVYHLYVVQADRRNRLREQLASKGIDTGIHYPLPIHLQPVYAGLGRRRGEFPVAERCAERIMSLPIFPEITAAEVAYIATAVKEAYGSM
jgi:dTDP-4-amino-4,6-dideoxygalactose transaminase